MPHIIVTGSSGGFVTVWDVKAKKESLTLNNFGRKPVSAVAWDPEKVSIESCFISNKGILTLAVADKTDNCHSDGHGSVDLGVGPQEH